MIGTLGNCLIALAAIGCSHDLGTSTCNSSGDDGNGMQIIHSQMQIQECWGHPHAETSYFVSMLLFSGSVMSQSLLKLMSIESVMPANHLILSLPLLLLPSIFPSIRVFSSESALHIRWPKYWSFSFSISPSNE